MSIETGAEQSPENRTGQQKKGTALPTVPCPPKCLFVKGLRHHPRQSLEQLSRRSQDQRWPPAAGSSSSRSPPSSWIQGVSKQNERHRPDKEPSMDFLHKYLILAYILCVVLLARENHVARALHTRIQRWILKRADRSDDPQSGGHTAVCTWE